MCEKFNGWKNKPTWLVNVWGWFDNPEDYEDLIKQAVDDQVKFRNTFIEERHTEILLSTIYFRLGELMEDCVKDTLAGEYGSGEGNNRFEQDLFNWSLAIVDWQRLAEHLEEPVKEYLKEAHSVVVK